MRKFLITMNVAVGLGFVIASIILQSTTLFTTGIVSFNIAIFIWWLGISENIVESSQEIQVANERIMRSNYQLGEVIREYQFILEEQITRAKGQNDARVTHN